MQIEKQRLIRKDETLIWRHLLDSNQRPTGQKHSRTASLGALALLLVSSCSRTACICHRQRRYASQ